MGAFNLGSKNTKKTVTAYDIEMECSIFLYIFEVQ